MELLVIVLLSLINGILAMSEVAIISSQKIRLTQRAKIGDKGAQIAIEMSQNPNRFLSTVQIGITLIGILAGAFGGTTIAKDLEIELAKIEFLRPYSNTIAVLLVVLLTTYLSLILGELVPKRMAMQNPEGIARIIAPPMRRISQIAYPLVWLLSHSTDMVLRLLGFRHKDNTTITEAEIQLMIEEGTQSGIFDITEQDMVTGVFRLDNLSVKALMTPRRDIIMLDIQDEPEQLLEKIRHSKYSRYAVTNATSENIIGVARTSDILLYILENPIVPLLELVQPPLFIPESATASDVLFSFRRDKQQFGFVIDEEGSIDGIVTLQDILEAIIGDIEGKNSIIKQNNGAFLVDGIISIGEFKDLIDLKEMPKQDYYHTLAGFILLKLGKIPSVGDDFVWNNYHFKVIAMDGHRVDKILVTPSPQE